MTIRLAPATPHAVAPRHGAFILYAGGTAIAIADTPEEGEQAKLAFKNVLLPRFTRDEAIAIVKKAVEDAAPKEYFQALEWRARSMPAVRAALEALAAARVFSDAEPECGDQYENEPRMADLLDAAGLR